MEKEISESIKRISQKIFPTLVKLRREFHQYPELAFKEFETAKRVERELRRLRLEVKTKVAKTGVVGFLKGKKNR